MTITRQIAADARTFARLICMSIHVELSDLNREAIELADKIARNFVELM